MLLVDGGLRDRIRDPHHDVDRRHANVVGATLEAPARLDPLPEARAALLDHAASLHHELHASALFVPLIGDHGDEAPVLRRAWERETLPDVRIPEARIQHSPNRRPGLVDPVQLRRSARLIGPTQPDAPECVRVMQRLDREAMAGEPHFDRTAVTGSAEGLAAEDPLAELRLDLGFTVTEAQIREGLAFFGSGPGGENGEPESRREMDCAHDRRSPSIAFRGTVAGGRRIGPLLLRVSKTPLDSSGYAALVRFSGRRGLTPHEALGDGRRGDEEDRHEARIEVPHQKPIAPATRHCAGGRRHAGVGVRQLRDQREQRSGVLSSLQQLGQVFGAWEEGELLDFPIPLSNDLSFGDAFGLAESYSGAVLSFLTDEAGFPAFRSAQELADLIPGSGSLDALTYDADTQTLNLSLDFFRTPDPIVRQADVSLIAGQSDNPIATLQMTPGQTGIDNRLEITRGATLGLDLGIDLSTGGSASRELVDLAASDAENVRSWTPMSTILDRLGMRHLANEPQTLSVQLRDGTIVNLDMGLADENTSLGEWLERGRFVRDGEVLMEITLEAAEIPFGEVGGFDDGANRFVIRDYSTPLEAPFGSVDVVFDYSDDGPSEGFNDGRTISDSDLPPSVTTVGEARRYVLEQVETHIESFFAASHPGETWLVEATFDPLSVPSDPPDPSMPMVPDSDTLAKAGPEGYERGEDFNRISGTDYPIILANHLNGGPVGSSNGQPGAEITFNSRITIFDYDVTGAPATGQESLFATALHEILHGLGIVSAVKSPTKVGTTEVLTGEFALDRPNIYDEFLQLSDGTRLVRMTDAERAVAVTGDDLFFAGPRSSAFNVADYGSPVKMYAPSSYVSGSQLTHLDPVEFDPYGDLMLPAASLFVDEPIFLSDLSAGIMYDLGYTPLTTEFAILPASANRFWETLLVDLEAGNPDGAIKSVTLNQASGLADLDKRLSDFFPASTQGFDVPSDALEVTLMDGTTTTILFGELRRKKLSDLIDALRMTSAEDGSLLLDATFNGTQLILTDLSTPTPDGEFSVRWGDPVAAEGNRLLERFVRPATTFSSQQLMFDVLPDIPYDGASPVDRSTTLGSLLSATDQQRLFGTESTAEIHTRSGDTYVISSGVLTSQSSLAQIIDSLRVTDESGIYVGATLGEFEDRILLFGNTNGNDTFEIVDTTPGGGVYSLLFDRHLVDGQSDHTNPDGSLYSDSLSTLAGARIDPLDEPSILVLHDEAVPAWTTVATYLERIGGYDPSDVSEQTSVSLRDGSDWILSVDNPRATTFGDLQRRNKLFRDGELTAEILFDGETLSLHDYTDGSGDLSQQPSSGRFWSSALTAPRPESSSRSWSSAAASIWSFAISRVWATRTTRPARSGCGSTETRARRRLTPRPAVSV